MANYSDLSFSDEEVIVIYLFGVIDGYQTVKKMYKYADRHLRDWFPNLPSYVAYIQRLNKVSDIFPALIEEIQSENNVNPNAAMLIDSFPVIMAKQGRRFNAKVAPQIASSGYCSTKKLYFYGVKVHVAGRYHKGTLPEPEYIGMYGAADHDGKVFDQVRPEMKGENIFGDKAYKRPDETAVAKEYDLSVFTPIKKQKGQEYLDAADQWHSRAVSSVRQPIESFFGWLEEKTGIEIASKVRSYEGLMVHVFGKIAAALFYWNNLRVI